jgi:cell division protein FtsA
LLLYGLQKQSDGISLSGPSNRDTAATTSQGAVAGAVGWVKGNF